MARSLRIAFAGIAVVATCSLVALAQTNGTPERYTATAVNMERGGAGTLEIVVNRWSTDAERQKLVSTLMDKGENKLLDALQSAPKVGYIRTPNSIGWDLHYANRRPLPDGGEQVVIATDRPIGFREAANQPRSIDYPFTVIEMHLNADGEGQGTMSVATKVMADKETGTIQLENFGTTPVMLTNIKREKMSQ
ncbi:MAG TPA: hypothetical protein VFA27_06145 [Vicinamibacterales bacterium]|nr:hypothetical protein [Vicinamibacterales bacterium]